MDRCNGITDKQKKCEKYVNNDEDFCTAHKYMEDFSDELMKAILDGTSDYKSCTRCTKWHNGDKKNCIICQEKLKAIKAEKQTNAIKCKGTANDGEKCTRAPVNNTDFCKIHDYMIDYTDEMMNNLQQCSGCRKYRYVITEDKKTCDVCKEISKKNRQNDKVNREQLDKCKSDGCTHPVIKDGYCGKHELERWKQSVEAKDKKVCAGYLRGCRVELDLSYPHQSCEVCLENERIGDKKLRDSKKEIAKATNIAIDNIISKPQQRETMKISCQKCKNDTMFYKLCDENNQYVEKCRICRNVCDTPIESEIDDKVDINEKAPTKINANQKSKNHDVVIVNKNDAVVVKVDGCHKPISNEILEKTMVCAKCPNSNNKHPVKDFILDGKLHQYKCNNCILKERLNEQSRKPRERDWAQELLNNPELAEKKKQWKEDNYDKCAGYQLNYKWKCIENNGIDEYHKRNNEVAKEYRAKNKDKLLENNLKKRQNEQYTIGFYKRRATDCGIEWNITEEFANQLFKALCYYCGEMDDIGLNGIDRVNNNLGYINTNVVSCCEVCNFMKCDMSQEIYIDKLRHILSRMFISDEIYKCDVLFKNHCGSSFTDSQKRMEKKNLPFSLTQEEFNIIQQSDCYMCGKQTNEFHINGIDRIDSLKGYVLENCFPCCGDCNKIKNKYSFDIVIIKMYKTICNFKHCICELNNEVVIIMFNTYIKPYNGSILVSTNENTDIDIKAINKAKREVAFNITRKNLEAKYGKETATKIESIKRTMRNHKNDINKTKELQIQLDEICNDPEYKVEKPKKLTKDEIRERNKIYKQQQRQRLVDKYGTDEARRLHALEVQKVRKKKNGQNNCD